MTNYLSQNVFLQLEIAKIFKPIQIGLFYQPFVNI